MVVVPRALLNEIIAHAQETPKAESCGILGGRDGRVERVYRARNVAETPRTRYEMDPRDIIRISDEIDEADLDLVGFYHSHTHTEARPSPTDVAIWPGQWYPDAICFICTLMEPDYPAVRAFRIDDAGRVTEEELTIED
jgi:proteasome lid subunit RPN8/RPN11